MKYLCLGIYLVSVSMVTAKPVELDGGKINFDAPDEFTTLTQEEIDKKFPSKNGPTDAVGNDSRGVTICYHLTDIALRPEQLPDAQKGMAQSMSRVVPGIQWIKNDIIEINGIKWIYYETTSNAIVGEIHNIEIATSYQGKLLLMNFNSTTQDFDTYQDKLRASLNSVKIKDDVPTQSLPTNQ